jgi:Fe-S cluster assembly ATP-binding protein
VSAANGGRGLVISRLRAAVEGREILHGIDLAVAPGEVHAVMGPNGSGKSTLSHVVMGRPGYEVLEGSVTLDGQELLGLPPWQRAQAGLFLALQYPIEVPGVPLEAALAEALVARGEDAAGLHDVLAEEARAVGFDDGLLTRPLNVDLSGGERKRNETVQLVALRPKVAILDEIDSGLDIDGLRAVSRRIERATGEVNLGVLAITHYSRLLQELRPDVVHVLIRGRIAETGGPELADELERTGYAAYRQQDEKETAAAEEDAAPPAEDPFADPLA